MNKKFSVTFTKEDKYRPTTRTVMIEARSDWEAGNICISQFGSYNNKGIPSLKVKINEIKLIEENLEKDLTNQK